MRIKLFMLAGVLMLLAGCNTGPARVVYFKKQPCSVAPTNCLQEFPKDWVLRINNRVMDQGEIHCVTKETWIRYNVDQEFDTADAIACTAKRA